MRGWCRKTAEARGRLLGDRSLLGWLVASTASSSSSAAVLQLRRTPCFASVHESEGRKGGVSAASMVVKVRAREVRGRGQHGLGHDRLPPRLRRSSGKNQSRSGSATAAPPSWRCTRGGEVGWRQWCGVWRGSELGRGIYARGPVHGGHGAGAVQRTAGLAIGAVEVWLRCWDGREQGWWRGDELCLLENGTASGELGRCAARTGMARGRRVRVPAGGSAA